MAVRDWLRSLAPASRITPPAASPDARVIVAPPDVSGKGPGAGPAKSESQTEDPKDPEKEDPECDSTGDEDTDTDETTTEEDPEKGKEQTMSTTAPTPTNTSAPAAEKPATIAELKSAFPGETEFIMDCAEKQLTVRDAKGAFADVLQGRLADTTKKLEARDQTVKGLGDEGKVRPAVQLAPSGAKPGAGAASPAKPVVADHVKVEGEAFDSYDHVVLEYQARGLSRPEAFRQAAIDHPALHEKWRAENGAKYTKMRAEARARRR